LHNDYLMQGDFSMTANPNKALWEKGDFTRLAATMRESGDALVNSLGVSKGLKVLDLGCGDGTTAIPEAKRGADVLGVDIASNLVAAGNRRAREMGLSNCRFQEGDASNLHELKDKTFDLVVSTPLSVEGADSLNVHLRSLVPGSIATIELKTSSPLAPPAGPSPMKPPLPNSGGPSLFRYLLELFSHAEM